MTSVLRKSKSLPVVIVEQHNDIVPFIHRAIASRRLPYSDVAMIHLDSHPDLLLNPDLLAETVFRPQELYESQSIENWILPLAFAKHIGHIVWIKPPWAKQIETKRQTFTIGKCVSTGKVRVTSKENYFLTDGLFCPMKELSGCSDVTLSVVEILPSGWSSLDLSYSPEVDSGKTKNGDSNHDESSGYSTQNVSRLLQDATKDRPYILDIDLDFFSTANPFKDMLSTEAEQALRRLYRYSPLTQFEDEDVVAFTKEREKQLQHLSEIFLKLEEKQTGLKEEISSQTVTGVNSQKSALGGLMEEGKLTITTEELSDLNTLHDEVVKKSPSAELTFTMLHDFGCTLDDTELPHHISTSAQISALQAEWRSIMEALPKPAIVTIARSSEDEYCPKDVVDLIQRDILKMLEDCYGALNITTDYS